MSNNTDTLLVLLLWAVVMPISAQSAITCGASVSATSVTLQADLGPCPGDGLFLNSAQSAVTVNLNGHKITGSGNGTGLKIGTSNGGVTIKGSGQIAGFAIGMEIEDDNVLVYNVTLKDNQKGITVDSAQGVRILYNTVTGGPQSSVGIETGNATAFVYNNTITNQTDAGIAVLGESAVTVDGNTILKSGTGILASPPDLICFKLRGNRVLRSGGNGIHVTTKGLSAAASPDAATVGNCFDIEDNEIVASGQSGIVLEKSGSLGQVLLQNNTVTYNKVYGIDVIGGQSSQVMGNVVLRNGVKDFVWDSTDSPNTCWSQNVYGTSSPAALPACP